MSSKKFAPTHFIFGFIAIAFLSIASFAQFRAGIQGTVTDTAGGAIAGRQLH